MKSLKLFSSLLSDRSLLVVFVVIVVVFDNKCAIGQQQCLNGNCTVLPHTPELHTNVSDSSTIPNTLTNPSSTTEESITRRHEDATDKPAMFQPTVPTTTTTTSTSASQPQPPQTTNTPQTTLEPRGRAINFTLDEHSQTGNGLSSSVANGSASSSPSMSSAAAAATKRDFGDLSDVSMDDDDGNEPVIMPKIVAPPAHVTPPTPKVSEKNETLRKAGICLKGGLTYEEGEKLEHGCDSICTCTNGKMDCADRCTGPFFRKGKKIEDPLCVEKETDDPCCGILACASDTETEPFEMCSHNNKTYHRGETIQNGCAEMCTCEVAGKIACKPRCPPLNKTSDRCVELPDPSDSCCKMVLCDVTLEDHDHEDMSKTKIVSAEYINSSTIFIKFDGKQENISQEIVDVGNDKINWQTYQILPGGYLNGLDMTVKYIRMLHGNDIITIKQTTSTEKPEGIPGTNTTTANSSKSTQQPCEHQGKVYKIGDEFNDNCTQYCMCSESGIVCAKLECPTYFGLDVVDPQCLEWETIPANFTATPPNCCPDQVKCKSNGTCNYKGVMYPNWQEIPSNITGCEQRCYCEMGHVECQNICPPVTAHPPSNLGCQPHHAELSHLPDDECCLYWMCKHPNMPQHPAGGSENIEKTVDQNRQTPPHLHPSSNDSGNGTRNDIPPFLNTHATDETTKAPSKIMGPLLIYENKPPATDRGTNGTTVIHDTTMHEVPDLQNLLPSIAHNPYETRTNDTPVTPPGKHEEHDLPHHHGMMGFDEPPYQHLGPFAVNAFKPQKPTKNHTDAQHPSYSGPFNPNYKPQDPFPFLHNHEDLGPPPTKPEKNKKGKDPSKTHPQNPIPPHDAQQIHFHSNTGTPEELLHVINQHPELTNYPSGSVFEIQHVPQKPGGGGHPFVINPSNGVPQNGAPNRPPPPNQQFIPYVINEGPAQGGHPQPPHLTPNGLTVEHILKQFQKGEIPPYVNFPPPGPQQNIPHNRNGPFVPNRPQQNVSYPGFGGGINGFPGNFPPPYQQDDIDVHTVEAINGQTVRLAFTVPPVIVGLHGRVEVRYTNTRDENLANWALQVFAPPNDLIATPQLEFDLVDLQPNSEYKIKITVTLRDLQNAPSSRIYTVRTPNDTPLTTLPPTIPIEPNLAVTEVNATWVSIAWRKFTDYELQFIDGVQLRYKEIDESIYSGATPLIHRAVTGYLLENLKPSTEYELGIFFIPFPGQLTELHTERMIHFTTTKEIDNYGFNVTLEIEQIKQTSVEVSWSGVPYPEDKYVNIYRAIYQSDSGKEDFSTFKLAKRDSPAKTRIFDLKPGTRYRLWLEVYLTNGKIKTSNVQDFITKPRAGPSLGASSQQGKLAADTAYPDHRGDYYGPLVIVAILAAIAILSTLILLLILVRRHSQNKAAITPPSRVSQSAYDNPTYKVEIQQETMDL